MLSDVDRCKSCLHQENCAVVVDDWDKEFISYVKQSKNFVPKLETIELVVESCESYNEDGDAQFKQFDLTLWQIKRLREFMSILEIAKMHQEGWVMVSGGFATVEIEDIEVEDEEDGGDDIIFLVEHGKQDADGKEVYRQKLHLPMKALNNKKITIKSLLKWLRYY